MAKKKNIIERAADAIDHALHPDESGEVQSEEFQADESAKKQVVALTPDEQAALGIVGEKSEDEDDGDQSHSKFDKFN